MANNCHIISESGSPFSGIFFLCYFLTLRHFLKYSLFFTLFALVLVAAVKVLGCHDLLHPARKRAY